ncbi:MAG: prolyl-tRNA synthetase [Deltaproteobacteria bacterium DG_8]|nr:MAG: prolyl-tRNA synthetase [Deltaproteobacteria bacterium DG_8]
MHYSQMFIPTLREDPSEAEVLSHRLMLRAGMIRKLAAGIYSYLPLAQKVFRKTEQIIREEMDRAGALEVTLPFVQPAEIWQKSGRWNVYGKELLRLKDRNNRDFCLGPTHEEVITELVKNHLTSYRQLPLNLYQIQIKFRDEIRPRFGIMRAREFVMKDAYSFDADEKGAEKSYQRMYQAYCNIFERCGLTFRAVEADTGPIGGSFSHEFMVLAETGEDIIFSCNSCGYAASRDKAEIGRVENNTISTLQLGKLQRVETPNKRTVEEVTQFLKIKPEQLIKTLIFQDGDHTIAVLIRGDQEINEIKLHNLLKTESICLASDEAIEKVTSAPKGFAGPVGLNIKIIADNSLKTMKNFVTGGNEKDVHLINVNLDRDFQVDSFEDIRFAQEGDPCPRCSDGQLIMSRGIEVGHIFKLGTKYSEALGAKFLDVQGKEKHMVMGCYGIGVGRTVAAAIEQNHDENGIIFPLSIAPFQVIVVSVNPKDHEIKEASERVYTTLRDAGIDAILDDRDERPGIKFKDADLIGIPLRITVGTKVREGYIDIKLRSTQKIILVKEIEIVREVKRIVGSD